MTDEEIISMFMEPRPRRHSRSRDSAGGWWRWIGTPGDERWEVPMFGCFTLDRLHKVEERLTDEQRLVYWLELSRGERPEMGYWRLIHASSNKKIKALAAVLRRGAE